jgi:pimeloyl-ACP methyl ester carboxylesterase
METSHPVRVVLVVMAACAMGGCVASGAEPTLILSPCTLDRLDEEADCGVLDVAEDPARPEGRRLPIHVAVLRARTATPAPDPLFVLAGGPGQGARSYAPAFARILRTLRRQRDLVFVDLRGTGASHALDCAVSGNDADPMLWRLATADLDACRNALEADVRFYAHEHALADLDEVRRALGYERINLWGGSYGTRAALLYALAYAGRVRTMTLDGAVPLPQRFPLTTAADGQRALDRVVSRCAADAACAATYPDLARAVTSLFESLERPRRFVLTHPVTNRPWTIDLDWRSVTTAVRVFLYSPPHVSLIPYVVQRAAAGDWSPFFALVAEVSAATVDTMALGTTLSIVCTEDLPRIRTDETAVATAGAWIGRADIEWWTSACQAWPRGPLPRVYGSPAPKLSMPALILSGDADPVTPPRWGDEMSRHFVSARHVVVPVAHNTTFSGCVPTLITEFIAAGGHHNLDSSCVSSIAWPPFTLDATGPRP